MTLLMGWSRCCGWLLAPPGQSWPSKPGVKPRSSKHVAGPSTSPSGCSGRSFPKNTPRKAAENFDQEVVCLPPSQGQSVTEVRPTASCAEKRLVGRTSRKAAENLDQEVVCLPPSQ